MPRIFYVHWHKTEGAVAVKALRAAGHTVIFHHSTAEGAGAAAWKSIRTTPPDAIVVSLARLPAHGRRIAAVTTQYKALRDIPVIFVGGEPDKVAAARKQFPTARFCSPEDLFTVLPTRLAAETSKTATSAARSTKVRAAHS